MAIRIPDLPVASPVTGDMKLIIDNGVSYYVTTDTLSSTISYAINSNASELSAAAYTSVYSTLFTQQYINQSGLTYTLVLSDIGYVVRRDHASDHSVIVPVNVFPDNTILTIRNLGTGDMTISPENLGVNLNYSISLSSNIIEPHFTAQLLHIGSNEWDIL